MTDTRNDELMPAPPLSARPASPQRPRALLRAVAVSLGFLLVYLLLYRIGQGDLRAATPLTIWQPAIGASVAVLLIFGLGYAPVVLLAGILAAFIFPSHALGRMGALEVALIDAAGCALAATLLRYALKVDPRLGRLRDVVCLLVIALLVPLLMAALNVAVLTMGGHFTWSDFLDNMRNWWVADAVGLMTMAPFLLAYFSVLTGYLDRAALDDGDGMLLLADETDTETHRPVWLGVLELLAWLAGIALLLWIIFYSPLIQEYRLVYLFFLLLIWVSLRHGMQGTTITVATISLGLMMLMLFFPLPPANLPPDARQAVVWMDRRAPVTRHAPIAVDDRPVMSEQELQIFLLTLSLAGLLAGAVVSERKRSVDAMRENERLLRTLINTMPDVVLFKNNAGRWLLANDYGLRTFQLENTPYHGKSETELAELHPETRDMLLATAETDEQAWQAGEAWRSEEALNDPDGKPLVFDVIKVPLFHDDGRRKGLVVIGRDITKRKLAEQERDTERAYLSSAIDILPLSIAFVTLEGELTQANAALGRLFTELPEHLSDGAQLLASDTRAEIPWEQWPLARACEGEMPKSIEAILELPDGREAPVLFHAAPIRVGGTLVAAVAALQDISALKEADRAKDEFLGILSHELLTPLNDILGWTQAAQDSKEMISQALEIIAHNVKLLQRILIDLLDISRIVHGKLFLTREAYDLWDLAEESAQEFAQSARERRRTLVLQQPSEDLPVHIDRARLRQAISILLANALKNTNPGDSITLTGSSEDNVAILTVHDTGRGIPSEALPAFFKAYQHGAALEPGRGLEMALVKGLIELHGGEVMVESAGVDQGTTFTIKVPLAGARTLVE